MFTIGSRGSALALVQTHWVRDGILHFFPEARIEIKIIRTSADRDLQTSIRSGSATGVFVKEIEDALLGRAIDLAVHSMKDVPTRIPDGLEIAAIPPREDPRDALITTKTVSSLGELPPKTRIGTGSIRRQAQLLALRPDLRIVDIRGNVDTRLRKMEEGSYDAIILACAGLIRLGMRDRITFPLELPTMLPAPGQGALALEIRKHDPLASTRVAALNHPPTAAAVIAERAFLRALGGGCNSPVGVHARIEDEKLKVEGLVAAPDGTRVFRHAIHEADATPEETGAALADKLLSMGAGEILKASHHA